MNNTTARVGLALLVVAMVIGIVWFFNRPDKPEQEPVAAGVESPEGNQEETPQPAPTPDPAQEPAEVNPPVKTPPRPGEVERLFQALETAAEVRDIEGANEARKRLAAIGNEEVHDRATALLEKARNDAELSRWARRILIANTLYLVALGDADSALSWLIERWSEPRLSEEGRADKWAKHDRLPVEHLAAGILDDEDTAETAPLGRILTWIGQPGEVVPGNLVAALKARYAADVPQGELPDPWLSGVFRTMMSIGVNLGELSADPLKNLLVAMRDNEALSARLRAQLAVYLVQNPGTIYDLLDAISRAESLRVAAEAIRKYLQTQVLTDQDVELLIAAVHQKFGATPDGPKELLGHVLAGGAPGIALENLQTLAANLLLALQDGAKRPEENRSLAGMIDGMAGGWFMVSARLGGSWAGTPMFEAWQIPDTAATVKRAFRTIKVPGNEGSQQFAQGRVLGMLWRSPLSVDEKLAATSELLRDFASLESWIPGQLLTAFTFHRGRFSPSNSPALVECLVVLFEKWVDPFPQTRPFKGVGDPLMTVSGMAAPLAECGFPQLPNRLRETLLPIAEALIKDSLEWPKPGEPGATGFDHRPSLKSVVRFRDAYIGE
jgi:hypothetical protein